MDCRFNFKATFNVYGGKDYTADMSCNWSAESGEIDERIKQFFLDAYEESYAKYDEKNRKLRKQYEQERLEAHEREELQRLKIKYET